jgi:hypothetical protein
VSSLLLLMGLALADVGADYRRGLGQLQAGDPLAASQTLLTVVQAGGRDPAAYHALGNALYRQGQLGPAVAAWRRAWRLDPRNGDLAANLHRGRKESADRLDPPGRAVGPFIWQKWMSDREGALGAGLLLGLSMVARLWRRRRGQNWGWESAAVGFLGLLLAAGTAWVSTRPASVVVVATEARVRSGMGADGVELFALHSGAEVAVLESAMGHHLVVLPDGRKGWLPEGALLSTDPAAPFALPDTAPEAP